MLILPPQAIKLIMMQLLFLITLLSIAVLVRVTIMGILSSTQLLMGILTYNSTPVTEILPSEPSERTNLYRL